MDASRLMQRQELLTHMEVRGSSIWRWKLLVKTMPSLTLL
jgi:hypothetical protein